MEGPIEECSFDVLAKSPKSKMFNGRKSSSSTGAVRIRTPTRQRNSNMYNNIGLDVENSDIQRPADKKFQESKNTCLACTTCSAKSELLPNIQVISLTDDNGPRLWKASDFRLGKPLGRGKFGNVYFAREIATGVCVALKVLFKAPLVESNAVVNVKREVEIQSRVSHPNIIQLHGVYSDKKTITLILENAGGGELFKALKSYPGSRLPVAKAKLYFNQISNAIKYLHTRHVIHRDIKLENILLDESGEQTKLADFGWAVHAPPPNHDKRRTLCGTPDYLAPEIIEGTHPYDKAVDLWALGVLLYEILIGKTPFNGDDSNPCDDRTREAGRREQGIQEVTMDSHTPKSKLIEATTEGKVRRMYQRIMSYQDMAETYSSMPSRMQFSDKRANHSTGAVRTIRRQSTASTASTYHLQYPDDNSTSLEAQDLILRLLRRDPQNRLSADSIGSHCWFNDVN